MRWPGIRFTAAPGACAGGSRHHQQRRTAATVRKRAWPNAPNLGFRCGRPRLIVTVGRCRSTLGTLARPGDGPGGRGVAVRQDGCFLPSYTSQPRQLWCQHDHFSRSRRQPRRPGRLRPLPAPLPRRGSQLVGERGPLELPGGLGGMDRRRGRLVPQAGRELPASGDWTFFAPALRAATMYE